MKNRRTDSIAETAKKKTAFGKKKTRKGIREKLPIGQTRQTNISRENIDRVFPVYDIN